MRRRDALTCGALTLAFLLVATRAAGAAGEWLDMYSPGALARQQGRMQMRMGQLFTILRGLIAQGSLTDAQARVLAATRIDVPLSDPAGTPVNFYSSYSADTASVTMPVFSLVFLEDLCTAYAWLYRSGHSLETVDEYLTMLRAKSAADFGGTYPSPLPALGVPANAIDNPQVEELGRRFRNSAYAFIMAHELGHVLAGHPSAQRVGMAQSRMNEAAADAFALSVLARASEIPMGAILFFQAQAYMMPSPGQFRAHGRSDAEWTTEMQNRITHPLTADRLQSMAAGLAAQASRGTGAEADTLRYIAVRLAEIGRIMSDTDLQQCMEVAAGRASPQDLRPQPQGSTENFLRKCVRQP
jgi:hypothetical protein